MNKFRVNINLLMYFVVNSTIIMVILVFFMVISVNRRLFRYFGSYSGISVIPVILVSRRTGKFTHRYKSSFFPQTIRDRNLLTDSLISASECAKDSLSLLLL